MQCGIEKLKRGIGFSGELVCVWVFGGIGSKFQTFRKCPIHACYCFIKTVSENVFGSTPLHSGIDSLNIIHWEVLLEGREKKISKYNVRAE